MILLDLVEILWDSVQWPRSLQCFWPPTPRRADSRPKMSSAAARRSVRVGGGGATNLAAAAAQRDRLRALSIGTPASADCPYSCYAISACAKLFILIKLLTLTNTVLSCWPVDSTTLQTVRRTDGQPAAHRISGTCIACHAKMAKTSMHVR